MPATLHLVSHTGPGAARMLARTRRLRRDLESTPGMIAGKLFYTSEFGPPLGALPTLKRWALLCAFTSDEAQAEFEQSAMSALFTEGAREHWRVTLEPVRTVNGGWRGWSPQATGGERLGRDEPIAVITYGVLRPRWTPRFMIENRRIVLSSMDADGLIARIGLGDKPQAASTFSIWRSQGDVARFAYAGHGTHKPIIRPSLDTPWGRDYFFARFRLRDASGTWDGRDPVAEARSAAAALARARGNGSGITDDDALDPGEVAHPAH